MRSIRCAICCCLVFAIITSDLDAVDIYKLYYIAELEREPTSSEAILQHQVSAHEAAEKLRLGLLFTRVPRAYSHTVQYLLHKLKRQTSRRNTPWNGEIDDICRRLIRYTALFATLKKLPFNNDHPVVLTALQQDNLLPQSDCMTMPPMTRNPVWTARRGSVLHAALIALPLRPVKHVQMLTSSLTAASGSGAQIPFQVRSVEYKYDNGSWQHKLVPVKTMDIIDGIQIYFITVKVPENTVQGLYNADFELKNKDIFVSRKLRCTLQII